MNELVACSILSFFTFEKIYRVGSTIHFKGFLFRHYDCLFKYTFVEPDRGSFFINICSASAVTHI